jgi:DNA (cytosine-5)-methyltransferase 1
MRYLSVCSGIEAATVAWHPLDWVPVAFADIEKFPSALLAHHYPAVPNHGDMTQFNQWPDHAIDLLVGGTPCQAFSVAGLRKGLDDPRGNLTLTFLALARRYRPRWVVWENVPGVLSDRGNAFGQFLAGLGELGYGWAYRVLDAQFFGVAQRRRRVFVVGYFGAWQPAAAVLLERESMRGDNPPGRKTGQGAASAFGVGPSGCREIDISPTLDTRCKDGPIRNQLGLLFFEPDRARDRDTVTGSVCAKWSKGSGCPAGDECQNLVAGTLNPGAHPGSYNGQDAYNDLLIPVSHSLRAEGFDASEDGTGRGTPLVPVVIPIQEIGKRQSGSPMNGVGHGADGDPIFTLQRGAVHGVATVFSCKDNGRDSSHDIAPTLRSMSHSGSHANGGGQLAVAFQEAQTGCREYEKAGTLRANRPGHDPVGTRIRQGMAVRRLTPRECERLQGFPDDYTQIPWRGKAASECPDGPRYRALGNSMAVPVMHWIGQRIALCDSILPSQLSDLAQ